MRPATRLVLGSNCRSAIATLVERQTRFAMLIHLPDGHGAIAVRDGLLAAIKTLPVHLRKTLTWDSHTGSAPGVGPGLTRRGIGFVPCPGFVGLVPAPGAHHPVGRA
jgi:hypothetical protein